MDVSHPHRAVARGLDGDVLVALAATNRPLSGRMVAGRVGHGSVEGVRKALQRLAESGLVGVQQAGGAYLYTLNRGHIAADAAIALANLRPLVVQRFRQAFEAWNPAPVHASLFGSAARGDGGPESDIDVFLVRPASVPEDDANWQRQLDELHRSVATWTGNHLSVVEFDESDLADLAARQPPVYVALRREGWRLTGLELIDLFGGSVTRREPS